MSIKALVKVLIYSQLNQLTTRQSSQDNNRRHKFSIFMSKKTPFIRIHLGLRFKNAVKRLAKSQFDL